MSCLTFDFEVKGQGHNVDTYCSEIPDIDLVL